jgi:hypothetical protein
MYSRDDYDDVERTLRDEFMGHSFVNLRGTGAHRINGVAAFRRYVRKDQSGAGAVHFEHVSGVRVR